MNISSGVRSGMKRPFHRVPDISVRSRLPPVLRNLPLPDHLLGISQFRPSGGPSSPRDLIPARPYPRATSRACSLACPHRGRGEDRLERPRRRNSDAPSARDTARVSRADGASAELRRKKCSEWRQRNLMKCLVLFQHDLRGQARFDRRLRPPSCYYIEGEGNRGSTVVRYCTVAWVIV